MFRFLKIPFLFSTVIFFSATANAEWKAFTADPQTKLEVIESSTSRIIVKFSFGGMEKKSLMIDGKEFTQVEVPDMSLLDEKGMPELPKLSRNLMIPYGVKPELKILSQETETLDLGKFVPSKGALSRDLSPENVPYSFAPFYNSQSSYPIATVTMTSPFELREVRGVNLTFLPMSFDNGTGMTTVAKEVVAEVTLVPEEGQAISMFEKSLSPSFMSIYADRFLNFAANPLIEPGHFVGEDGPVLVITPERFVASLEPYIRWKTEKGLKVELATLGQIGTTPSQIRGEIKSRFEASGLTHVILVGDAEDLPFYPGEAGNAKDNEADPRYALVKGNDNYPDLFVSRLSAKNPQELDILVNKIINYEKFPDLEGDWYAKATGIASNEGAPTDYERAEILRKTLEAWHYQSVDQFYDPDKASADTLSIAFNEGRGFINYIGHGSKDSWVTGKFNNGHVLNLKNENRLPFIVSVACVNGDFAGGDDSFAEAWTKAGTKSKGTGAIAIFASSTNQSWVPPTVGQKEIANLLTKERARTIGGLFFHGSVAVLEDNSSTAVQTFETWHIFGDSTLEVRTEKPKAISYDIPKSLHRGLQSLTLDLEPGIRVGVTSGGKLVGTGYSGNDGKAMIGFSQILKSGDQVLVTFTGNNKIPVQKLLSVE